MKKIKNILEFFKPDEDNFVTPVKLDEKKLISLVNNFHSIDSNKDFKNFHKEIISVILAESGFTNGTDIFYESISNILGYYNHFSGALKKCAAKATHIKRIAP